MGLDEANVLGPLQNKAQYDIVAGLVRAGPGRRRAHRHRRRPGRGAAPGYFYPATLVADIDNDNPLVAQEQFGPALPIVKYTDLDQAIDLGQRVGGRAGLLRVGHRPGPGPRRGCATAGRIHLDQ